MKTERAQEIAISYINGNISWVKERTKRKADFVAVLNALKEFGSESVDSFIRVCGN